MLYSTLAACQNVNIMKRHLVTMTIENCVKLLLFHYCHFSCRSFFSNMKWKRYDISEPYVIATKTPCTAIYIQTGCCSDGTLQCSGNTMFLWTVFTVVLLIFQNYRKCLHTKRTHFLNGRETLSSGSSKSAAETPSSQILGNWLFSRWIFLISIYTPSYHLFSRLKNSRNLTPATKNVAWKL